MNNNRKIELLSPAKNLECGLAAISHGADAVYIGGPKFGAREDAGNPITDIEKLSEEAHLFGSKVYVALNTILYDHELETARKMIYDIYDAGADALIIQDMGILEMDLPPIPLHASTQAHNFHLAKIEFLEKAGFKRVVLARELSLDQIREIRSKTSVELEAFVHGALCVSMSGQCYLSHAIGGRSANRGACAQPCRKKYSLTDAAGNVLVEDKYLLSLKDLDHSESISRFAEAGVTSFKIEGRLKDADYVKNITAFYRKKIDAFLEEKPGYEAASFGKVYFSFNPDPKKSFSRGSTDYFLYKRSKDIVSFDTPKSLGEELGIVSAIGKSYFEIETAAEFSNNDGLVFISENRELCGIKVNRVENKRIFPDKMNGIYPGVTVYRNYDHAFRKLLKSNNTFRKIRVEFWLEETSSGFLLKALDESGCETEAAYDLQKIPAKDPNKSKEMILRQLGKSGDSVFEVCRIETGSSEKYYFQASVLNSMRRDILEQLTQILKKRPRLSIKRDSNSFPFPVKEMDYKGNVSNHLARQFYQKHGIADPGIAFEKLKNHKDLTVMTTKHCLKYQAGYCQRFDKNAKTLNEPVFLVNNSVKLQLEFDCLNCQMNIKWLK